MRKIEILDCTLRDGSYVLDFNFSLIDSLFISKVLFESGINYVEIGHGLGLGASEKKNYKSSLYSDNEYIGISNLAKISKHNKIGSFCFTKNVTYKNFEEAKSKGLDFIRFAYEERNLKKLKQDIEYCNKIGLEVHLNLIKTYKYSFNQIEMIIKKINKLKIKYLYVVDSSGGMTTAELVSYLRVIKKNLKKNIYIGFHGHNNLGIANANCIAAIENGASIVDTSMLGMGRGAGNAITESLAAYMQREKIIKGIDLKKILNFIKNYLGKIFPQKYLIENVLIGKSYFHDGEINKLKSISKKNKLNYMSLLDKTSFRKGINLNKISKFKEKINMKNDYSYSLYDFKKNQELISENWTNLEDFKKNLSALCKKKNCEKVLTICRGKIEGMKIYNEAEVVIGHIISKSNHEDIKILKKFNNYKIFFDESIKRKNFFNYSEKEIKEKACLDIINSKSYSFIKFVGNFKSSFKKKVMKNYKYEKSSQGLYIANSKKITKFKKKSYVIILSEITEKNLANKDIKLIKPNYGLVLTTEVRRVLSYAALINKSLARVKINKKLYVIEKGNVGKENDIIVDSVDVPNRIIGQSDGCGGIKDNIALDAVSKKNLLNWMFKLSIG